MNAFDPTNEIDPTARIASGVTMGKFNRIGAGVVIEGFKGGECKVTIGDCNTIHDGTRLIASKLTLGDYNVIHNHGTFGGPGPLVIGHNGWFGQENWLDSTGGLTLGNGVRVGLRSHIWSHVASGEEIEGWLCAFRPTVLEDDVWLVGDDVHVASGVTMGARSVAMSHAVVTKDTKPDTVYVGMPAREVSFKMRRDTTLDEKRQLMLVWVAEFCKETGDLWHEAGVIVILRDEYWLEITTGPTQNLGKWGTSFSLSTKRYTKRLTQLERDFYRFLFGHRARFLPY